MLVLLAQAAAEPPPGGLILPATDLALKHAEAHPDIFFPLLAICGPVLVGFALIWAGVKYGIPFVREQLAEFRKHTADLLKAKGDDAIADAAAARELARTQQDAIVQRIEGTVSRQTGEIQKIAERQERQGDLLRSVAQKVGAGVLLVLLALGLLGGARRYAQTGDAPVRCSPACNAGFQCVAPGKCVEIKTGTATASKHSTLRLRAFANVASYGCSAAVVCP